MAMTVDVYTIEGKKNGTYTVPDVVMEKKIDEHFLAMAYRVLSGNVRAGTAHTKDRSEVRGGGKKPYAQKKTGNARHGSRRSPIWVGGGVTFGPRSNRNHQKKINKKQRIQLRNMLLKRFIDTNKLFVVDSFDGWKEAKTKTGDAFMKTFGDRNVLVESVTHVEPFAKSVRNLPYVSYHAGRGLHPLAMFKADTLVLEQGLLDALFNEK
jgi:large subunit ribosomal protein L4